MTTRALTSALSGLRVHQSYLDVIGNNLANSSTTAYRGSRVTFSDVISQTLRAGSGPTGNLAGINAMQVGLGVRLHTIDVRATQGALLETGRPFDLGIQGEGFFVLSNGSRNFFTRAGNFGLDAEGHLVDRGSGMRARNATGADLTLPVDEMLPAVATSTLQLGGNLPAEIGGPLQEVLTTSVAFQEGTPATLLGQNVEPFALADGNTMDISVNGGVAETVTFRAADFANIAAATAAEVAAVVNTQLGHLDFSAADVGGQVELTTDRVGESTQIQIFDGSGSPASILGLDNFAAGTQIAASDTTDLNQLVDTVSNYVNGDQIQLSGTNAAGTVFNDVFVYGTDGTTLGEMVTFLDGLVSDATAELDSSGNIALTADEAGEAELSVTIQDSDNNAGQFLFSTHALTVSTEGTGPDQATTSIDVFDAAGLRHTLTITLTRMDAAEWDLEVTTDNPADTILDGSIQGIQFNPDGTFSTVTGAGVGDVGIDIAWEGSSAAQSFSLDLGTSGSLDGLTQLGDAESVRVLDQDGSAAGELISATVRTDGVVEGIYSNGRSRELDQLAIATFANPGGLLRSGDSLFEASTNSGEPQILTAGVDNAGVIVSGALEGSNVDVAEEFVRLIEAQRGFQANARVIRASDEMLVEVVNLV